MEENRNAMVTMGCVQGCEYPVCTLGDKCPYDKDTQVEEVVTPAPDGFTNPPVEE